MNDLTMGPLPARIKKERHFIEDRKSGTRLDFPDKLVFRCGVLSCPEVLGWIRPHLLHGRFLFRGPYVQNAQGIFALNQRSARRFKDEREQDKRTQEEHRQMRLMARQKSDWREAVAQSIQVEQFVEMEQRLHDKHALEGAQIPDPSLFPLVVRCARCGRLSKIKGAETAA